MCAGVRSDVFFPIRGGSSKDARAICAQCGGRVDCLMYALNNHEIYGLWGGTGDVERRQLKRMMRTG